MNKLIVESVKLKVVKNVIRLKVIKLKVFLLFAFFVIPSLSFGQYIDNDTTDVVIRRTNKMLPKEYSISDVIIKLDKEKTKNIIRVDLDIPLRTTLRLSVSDTSGNKIMNLISDQTLSGGVYRVRWEMIRCVTSDCDYPAGKYWCEFETDQFIFQRDFYIK